jgi:acyl-ACP thioesterase
MTELIPQPERGRTYSAHRLARLGDVSPAGRLRLDAVARYLQDVANDDAVDADLEGAMAWVVRRTVMEVAAFPSFRESLRLTTFASGSGRSWAERRTSIEGDRGGRLEAAALWVYVDPDSGRPRALPDEFVDVYGEATGGRRVRARLEHPDAPPGLDREPWPLRFADFDALGHVNNAVYLEVVEEHLARRRELRAPLRVEVEFRTAVEPDHEVAVVSMAESDGGLSLWVVGEDDTVHASARISSMPRQ